VQHELLSVYATQLLEKENSGCHVLLRDDKVKNNKLAFICLYCEFIIVCFKKLSSVILISDGGLVKDV
jgi:hypothetical protein